MSFLSIKKNILTENMASFALSHNKSKIFPIVGPVSFILMCVLVVKLVWRWSKNMFKRGSTTHHQRRFKEKRRKDFLVMNKDISRLVCQKICLFCVELIHNDSWAKTSQMIKKFEQKKKNQVFLYLQKCEFYLEKIFL